jgi:hypothetical protein
VAEIEDDIPNVDEIISPDETAISAEETAPPAEVEPAPAEVHEAERPVSAFDEETPQAKPPLLEIAVAIGVPVVCIALAFLGFLNFSTALYIIGLAYVALMTWMGRETNTVYTVILGCVLIALLTSVYCLWTVLAKYGFDVKAQEAKGRAAITRPVDHIVLRG